MKCCPNNKSHKNPKDAVFCSDCGAKLYEVVDNKVCLHCDTVNPTSATFCTECGAKLSDEKGNIELTVCSSEQCERIQSVGTTSYKNNTKKCVLKVPAKKQVDVLLQYNGKAFRATADLTRTTTLNVNWGTIEIHCDNACQLRLDGNNMDTPLVKTASTGHEIIKVPHGQYKLRVELDGEVEEKMLNVHEPVIFHSKLHKEYHLTINSDAQIDQIKIDNDEAIAVHKSDFCLKKRRGIYTLSITATRNGAWGNYEVEINLNEDTTLKLLWCQIKVLTNSSESFIFRQVGTQMMYQYIDSSPLLAVQGVKHQLEMKKPHGEIYTEVVTPNEYTMEIVRKWGDVTINFNRAKYGKCCCRYNVYTENSHDRLCCGTVPSSRSVVVEDLPYGSYRIEYGISHEDYSNDNSNFTIDGNKPTSISVTIPTERTQSAKWRRLRYTFFYINYFFCLPFVLLGGVGTVANRPMQKLTHEYGPGWMWIVAIISLALCTCYISILFKKNRKRVILTLRLLLGIIVINFIASLGLGSGDGPMLALFPLIFFGIPTLISFVIYKIQIKGWSIWEDIFY